MGERKERNKLVVNENISISSIFFTIFFFIMFNQSWSRNNLIMIVCFGLLACILLLYVLFTVFISLGQIKNYKRSFFKENIEEILVLKPKETFELTVMKQENSEDKFLISTMIFQGNQRQAFFSSTTRIMFDKQQIFNFAIKTTEGILVIDLKKGWNSHVYYNESNDLDCNKPRLEIRAVGFASKKIKKEFGYYSNPRHFFAEYTFFIPKESVKKIFI